jgi:hypothetical protein
MDKKEFELLARERDAHIEKIIQAKRDLARLKKLRTRTYPTGTRTTGGAENCGR